MSEEPVIEQEEQAPLVEAEPVEVEPVEAEDDAEASTDEKDPTVSRRRRLRVTVIETRGQSVLVEYIHQTGRRRVYVPVTEITKGCWCPQTILTAGIPYGVPWKELLADVENGEALAARLIQLNIWSNHDIEVRGALVMKTLKQTKAGIKVGALRRLAQNYEVGG